MKSIFKIAQTIILIILPFVTQGQNITDPDSLRMIQGQFRDVARNVEKISQRIQTPEDAQLYEFDINDNKSKIDRLENEYPDIKDDKKIVEYRRQIHECWKRIERNIQEYRHEQTLDSLQNVLSPWPARFDSLLAAGQRFSENKEADSVRQIKNYKATEWWNQISTMKSSYPEYFSEDEILKTEYSQIEQTKNAIQELSEKEKVKLRDILLVAGVIVGVMTMVIGMVGSRIREHKLQKKAEEMPPLEL